MNRTNEVKKRSSDLRFSKIGMKKVIFLEKNNFPEVVVDFSFSNTNKEDP
jgi:hypothetical protein